MNFLIQIVIFIVFIFSPYSAFSTESKPVEMLAGLSKPPFVIAESDKGMQLEIIEAAFAKSDKVVRFTYLPLNRHLDVLHSREFDGIITLAAQEKAWGICLSKPYIIYQNVVITLEESALSINNFDDLVNLKVAAFKDAARFLGENYRETFKNSSSYTELADQKSQIGLLFSGRVDALVMDVNIFKHLLAKQRKSNSSRAIYNKKYQVHFLFKPRVYTAGFKSKQLCQQFDQGIKAIMDDGSYQKIIDSYLN